MALDLLRKMHIAQSVQRNVPYGSSLMRAGDVRKGGFVPPELVAGLATAAIPPLAKLVERPFNTLIGKPVNWLWDKLGFGEGGALYRSGGFYHRPGDIGMYVPASHDSRNSAGFSMGEGMLTKRDHKNLRVLEKKLGHLTNKPEKFMKKLMKIHAKGEAYLKKKRHALKKKTLGGIKKYKHSKRYKTLKLKYYSKHPKATSGKYHGSAKYKKHKAKYVKHHQKKRS